MNSDVFVDQYADMCNSVLACCSVMLESSMLKLVSIFAIGSSPKLARLKAQAAQVTDQSL